MEISTRHLVHFTPTIWVGWNQLKPDQSSLVQSSAHDKWEQCGLLWHFCFGLQQERLCKTDLSGLKLSVSIANPCSKLSTGYRSERDHIKHLGSRLFMFRT